MSILVECVGAVANRERLVCANSKSRNGGDASLRYFHSLAAKEAKSVLEPARPERRSFQKPPEDQLFLDTRHAKQPKSFQSGEPQFGFQPMSGSGSKEVDAIARRVRFSSCRITGVMYWCWGCFE